MDSKSDLSILSMDQQIFKLIDDVKNSSNGLDINDLLKIKLIFQLSKISLGLKLVSRLINLYNYQEAIENRLLTTKRLDSSSEKELLILSSFNSRRLDNYYNKVEKIFKSLNFSSLEGALLSLSELNNNSNLISTIDKNSADELQKISLKLIQTISTNNNIELVNDPPYEELTQDDLDNADKIDQDYDKFDNNINTGNI